MSLGMAAAQPGTAAVNVALLLTVISVQLRHCAGDRQNAAGVAKTLFRVIVSNRMRFAGCSGRRKMQIGVS
jgi:hypothetical protein